jgi:hypothetical protein
MDYRLYVLDAAGSIRSRTDFQSPSDDDACARAEAEALTQPVELWQGQRRIGSFGSSAAAARSA